MSAERRSRVLIVEDEYLVAETYRSAVEELGYEVKGPAPTVAFALELLERESVDAALLDVLLRGRLVSPVVRRLREIGVPFVFLSGADVRDVLPEEFHDVPVLDKPTTVEELGRALREMLAEEDRPVGGPTPG